MEKPLIHRDTDIDLLVQMLDHVTDLVFLMEVQGTQFIYQFINKKARQILGLSDATLGQSILSAHDSDKAVPLHQAYQRVVRSEKTLVFRQQVRTPTGMFTGESKLTPLYNSSREVTHILGIVQDVSTLKVSEDESELNRQRYKSLFDFHPDGIIAYNLKGQLVDGNFASSKITGYQFGDASEHGFTNFILDEYKDVTRDAFAKSIEHGKSVQYETAIYHKEGHVLYLSIVNIPISVNDEIVGAYGVFKDISRERELARALKEKNKDLETLWNTAINPVFQLNLDGTVSQVNPAFRQLFEYDEQEIQETLYEIVPEYLQEEMLQLQKRLDHLEPIESYETQRITKSGKLLDILASYTPVYNEHGEPTGIHVVYNNITKLKNTQRELDQSKEKYKVITEYAFDVIKVFNRNGRADYLSPSIKHLLGHEPSECIGKQFTEFIHPEDHAVVQKNLQLLLVTRKHCTMELRMRHIDGHYVWMEVVASPVIERGRVINIITISRDISERYSMQEALKQMAYYDHLSGLPNRRAFDDRLQDLIDTEGQEPSLALLLVDGNQFKQINDTYGHDAGDAVIVEMAKRLSTSVRQNDLVARLGGDEIGILLGQIRAHDQVEAIINRIIEAFKEPFLYKHATIPIEIALGIALYPQDAQDKKALFIAADNALYESKKTRATCHTYYEQLSNEKKQ
ncbi:sensor domain-containing protein [Tetzosporium hominis]|nr:PAS domain S-box protein [Tetzosporium hominis]